jgi:nucleotide-binding universal stress UspA family protein
MTVSRAILVGVDFSPPSRVALEFAARLARQRGAELHVLHAEDPLLNAAARHHGIDLSAETRSELEKFVATAPPAAACRPHLHVVTGRAVEVLCRAATDRRIEVIVVGSHGMSGPTRLVFGSTTEGVLRNADRSVFVVPAEWEPPRPDALDLQHAGPVIAAVDFSEESLAAAAAAAELARALKTSLEAVHVVAARPVPARWQRYADAATAERRDAAGRDLAAAMAGITTDVPTRVRVETGAVPQALAGAAARAAGRHPILVLGRRPPGERGAAPGATAYRVLALTSAPVLLHVPGDSMSPTAT